MNDPAIPDPLAKELAEKSHALGERVKELNCLYSLSKLADKEDIPLSELLQGVANLLPPAWQYPEVTCGRVVVDSEEYKTKNFKQTAFRQAADIRVDGIKVGIVEVYYLETRPESFDGPFLREERNLINAIAEQLGKTIERMRKDEALRASEAKLREQKKVLEQKNIALREVLGQIEFEKKQIKENVITNIEELILPNLEMLRVRGASRKYVNLIRKDLEELASDFGKKISEVKAKLSPREIQICNMIKKGLSNKEISSLLNIATYTIEKHRFNIRKKLNLSKKGHNLITYLQSL
jgi:ATP/maltotriose-dependent transcriptional regulator MalT